MSRGRTPSYRLHKASGQAVVTLGGKDHYLGRHGSEASKREYDRLVGRWIAEGRQAHADPGREATVDEVILAFWKWAEGYYVKDGGPTSQLSILRSTLRSLRAMYGDTPARDFTPTRLKALRDAWVREGVSRVGVNRKARVVVQALAWAVEHEMVPGSTAHALRSVRPLAPGRTEAPETPRVLPVPEADLEATLPRLNARDAAMARLQLASGMRPGEVCIVRPCDVDRSGAVWAYRPHTHKSIHHGKERVVYLGPEAQRVLAPWLEGARTDEEYLFRAGRNSRRKGLPMREHTYYRNVLKACRRAGVEAWTPNQLRHVFGTRVRARFGIEVARILLGHSSAVTSEIYSEVDEGKAKGVIGEMG